MTANRKVALVTGASKGIGAQIAKHLAMKGYRVVINYSQNKQTAELVKEEIEAKGGEASLYQADVSDPQQVDDMFAGVIAEWGGVDFLINNAGVMALSPLQDTSDESIDRHININLKGSLYTMRAAAKRLNQGGSIVNLSTSVVGLKLENYSVYAATKSAIETATGILAKELRGRQITVNAIAPGPTATDLFLQGKPAELIDKMAKMSPLERLGEPQDIANLVAFLIGSEGSWVNGQVIRANGGVI
ncbi:SDR family oxidoreductase [Marinomonas dokdonensis]|uniref:SDR family oxidoreductase n=1 Tax=Marinomonas dokdonensis TaxID=328224 RepID=UPI004055820B